MTDRRLKLRYKEPDGGRSRLLAYAVTDSGDVFGAAFSPRRLQGRSV